MYFLSRLRSLIYCNNLKFQDGPSLRTGQKSASQHSLFWPYVVIFEFFWKNSSYVSGLSVCISVALCVRISVAGANKVEGTMIWWVGTNEVMASNVTFTRLKVKQGPFETAILILYNFSPFFTAKGVWKHSIEISLWLNRWVQGWSCLRVHILVWVLLQDFDYRERYNARIS